MQALSHTVAGAFTYGCRLFHIRLQALSHTFAGAFTYGCWRFHFIHSYTHGTCTCTCKLMPFCDGAGRRRRGAWCAGSRAVERRRRRRRWGRSRRRRAASIPSRGEACSTLGSCRCVRHTWLEPQTGSPHTRPVPGYATQGSNPSQAATQGSNPRLADRVPGSSGLLLTRLSLALDS